MILLKKGNNSVLPMNLQDFKGMKCLLGEPFDLDLLTEDICCIGDADDDDESA